MWRLAFLTLVCFAFDLEPSHGSESFPFSASIAADNSEVRAGPSLEYYATDRLSQGVKIEVHRRDPGGWLAIRPPEHSFSWVPTAKLWTTNREGVADVITDDALAWVGSRIEDVKEHKWQVKLQRGERVVVLGEKQVFNAANGVTEAWIKIAPPAGEFRWIHERQVSLESNTASLNVGRRTPTANKTAGPLMPVQQAGFLSAADSRARLEVEQTGGKVRIPSLPEQPTRSREDVARVVTPDDIKLFDRQSLSQSGRKPLTGGTIEDEFAELEAQLALMVAKEPNYWHLNTIREQTEALVERGTTPVDRGRARLLLAKVEQFEDIRRRHIQIERTIATSNNLDSNKSASGVGNLSAAIEPRFDGSGWLVPVHSTKRLAPPFAILDESGKVLQYVSPAPGLNLQRYVRKRVGVYGQKSAQASLNAPHLTAHQVVDLDRHAIR